MASCERIRKGATKVCLGDLDTLVNIKQRDLSSPKDVKYGLNLTDVRTNVWCMWQTSTQGISIFDGTNQLIGTATDIITIQYDAEFEKFDYIEYNDNLFEVLKTRILDHKNKEFIVLYCNMRGDKNKKVNIL